MLGGGSGHIQDMNNRMRDNKKLRQKRRSTKEKHNDIGGSNKERNKPLKFNSNPEQYSKVKKRIQQRRKRDQRITRIILMISVLAILTLIALQLIDWSDD